MRPEYRRWLEGQDYSTNTINTQTSHATRVEQAYGNLDDLYGVDRLESVLASLRYSTNDARRGVPNPSQLQIGGDLYKSLAGFRTAVGLYRRFLDETGKRMTVEGLVERQFSGEEKRERIGLERDLQRTLRRNIDELEPGLMVIDEGAERPVASGYIDITARDNTGKTVVIELKTGTADRSSIGQILSYMGDVAEEEAGSVRGILVAHDFDAKARAAARMVSNLQLRVYAIRFSFSDA